MLMSLGSAKILLFADHCDMRKGAYSLAALVKQSGLDPHSGDLFVFLSRREDRVKILAYATGGFILWYKTLEKGRFKRPELNSGEKRLALEAGQLMMLLEPV